MSLWGLPPPHHFRKRSYTYDQDLRAKRKTALFHRYDIILDPSFIEAELAMTFILQSVSVVFALRLSLFSCDLSLTLGHVIQGGVAVKCFYFSSGGAPIKAT